MTSSKLKHNKSNIAEIINAPITCVKRVPPRIKPSQNAFFQFVVCCWWHKLTRLLPLLLFHASLYLPWTDVWENSIHNLLTDQTQLAHSSLPHSTQLNFARFRQLSSGLLPPCLTFSHLSTSVLLSLTDCTVHDLLKTLPCNFPSEVFGPRTELWNILTGWSRTDRKINHTRQLQQLQGRKLA